METYNSSSLARLDSSDGNREIISPVATLSDRDGDVNIISAGTGSEERRRAPLLISADIDTSRSTAGYEDAERRTYVSPNDIPGRTILPASATNDDIVSPTNHNQYCDCFNQNDNDRFGSLALRRGGATVDHRAIYLECERCGRSWPIENGDCFVGCGAQRRMCRVVWPIDELHRGDHVIWTQVFAGISYHHGIVSSVEPGPGRVWLVAFQRRPRWTTLWPNSVDGSINGICENGQVKRPPHTVQMTRQGRV